MNYWHGQPESWAPRQVRCLGAIALLLVLTGLGTVSSRHPIGIPFALAAEAKPAAEGGPAPDFSLPDLEGRRVRLSDYRGRVVLLHFWATWCPHCVKEMELLEKSREDGTGKGLSPVVAINLGEPVRRVEKFVRKLGLSYPVLLDGRGRVAQAYGVVGLPATIVVSPEGMVMKKLSMGALTLETLQSLSSSGAPPP